MKASLTPRRATVGRWSAVASRAAREAWPLPTPRPSASASIVFTRPARRAGTAVKSATAARMSPSAATRGSGASALGVGVARTFDIGSSSSGAIAAPATSPSSAATRPIARYSPTSSATIPRGVKPTALSSPISRRCASTRPPITVATVKPTANSASSVLIPITSAFVRVWSVIVSRTSCQSVSASRVPGSARRAAAANAAVASGSRRWTATRRPGACTSVAQTRPGPQRGYVACWVVTARPATVPSSNRSPTRRPTSRAKLRSTSTSSAVAGSRPSVTRGRSIAALAAGSASSPTSVTRPPSVALVFSRALASEAVTPGRAVSAATSASLSSP